MRNRIIIYGCILLGLSPLQAYAGGSVRLDTELAPLLNQKPLLKKFLFESFDLAQSGWTPNRIGWQVNEKFGGRRLGPYSFKAKPKNQEGDYVFEIIFHAEPIFLDRNGEPTVLRQADRITEKFQSFEIKLIQVCDIHNDSP